jgi:undecaprenyl diphosphate synthase
LFFNDTATTEIYTTGLMWPDFRKPNLVEALLAYQERERRFGLTGAQVRGGEGVDA